MEYCIYKLKFVTPIHMGSGKLSSTDMTINADTIFSALCIQASKIFGADWVEKFIIYAKNGKILMSDAMPYVKEKLYIRKPLKDNIISDNTNSTTILDDIKKGKKIQFINIEYAKEYIKDTKKFINESNEYIDNKEIKKKLGCASMRTMSSSQDEEKSKNGEMLPFRVEVFNFNENSGLYIIVGFDDEDKEMKKKFKQLLISLQYVGIGGKKSSGFGKFEVKEEKKIKEKIELALKNGKDETEDKSILISLSLCMYKKNERDEKDEENEFYKIIKRGGFIDSDTYLNKYVKKRNFYAFESGSTFKKGFEGDIFIVKNNGQHFVYKYAKPIFLEVKIDE